MASDSALALDAPLVALRVIASSCRCLPFPLRLEHLLPFLNGCSASVPLASPLTPDERSVLRVHDTRRWRRRPSLLFAPTPLLRSTLKHACPPTIAVLSPETTLTIRLHNELTETQTKASGHQQCTRRTRPPPSIFGLNQWQASPSFWNVGYSYYTYI